MTARPNGFRNSRWGGWPGCEVRAPSGVHEQISFGKVWGSSPLPGKLNTFTYLAVNFACIFAHGPKRYEYAKKSVCLLHLQPPEGCITLILSPCICHELDFITHCQSLFYVFIG